MATLTPYELDIMNVLWEHGPLKPAEIQERFPRMIRNAALRSALLVLLEKGHVTRQKKGRAYYYRAKTPRKGTLRKMAGRMANIFTGGSKAALIAQLIEIEDLSEADIQKLREVAAKKSGKPEWEASS